MYQTLVQINTKYAEEYFCSHIKVLSNVSVFNSIDFDCEFNDKRGLKGHMKIIFGYFVIKMNL